MDTHNTELLLVETRRGLVCDGVERRQHRNQECCSTQFQTGVPLQVGLCVVTFVTKSVFGRVHGTNPLNA